MHLPRQQRQQVAPLPRDLQQPIAMPRAEQIIMEGAAVADCQHGGQDLTIDDVFPKTGAQGTCARMEILG